MNEAAETEEREYVESDEKVRATASTASASTTPGPSLAPGQGSYGPLDQGLFTYSKR